MAGSGDQTVHLPNLSTKYTRDVSFKIQSLYPEEDGPGTHRIRDIAGAKAGPEA